MMTTPSSISEEIAREEARLETLERERAEALARIERLRQELKAVETTTNFGVPTDEFLIQTFPEPPASTLSTDEKIAIFRRRFRGREDVFPKMWINRKTGKKGYAPACANEWASGICDKPRIKCGDCPHRMFIPLSDKVILDHLQGRHVIGVYPLLPDETCFFLAADFDRESWQDDVAAFARTSRELGAHVAVERSRSGNGAHVWFFFNGAVPAGSARAMGCFLLTETMSRRRELGMDSYDRFFPNQDTMPSGGFGNLIALPLQHEARKAGNTLFLDEQFKPYSDQWASLNSSPAMSADDVARIAAESRRIGNAIGVPVSLTDEENENAPWVKAANASKPEKRVVAGPLPESVDAVLAQRLYVKRTKLPQPLLNAIRRLAAFQNPEFHKKQALRFSTALTPRVICCAEDDREYLSLPRGCVDAFSELMRTNKVAVRLSDLREDGQHIDAAFHGELTPIQKTSVEAMLAYKTGVLVAPPGSGKTVVGAYLVAARARNTLVLVHRKPILDQWVERLSRFLGIPPKSIGQIGGGKNKQRGRVDVAIIQSLVRKENTGEMLKGYGQVIVDECHHLPAVSFEGVLSKIKARYVVGLTATPYRRDGHQPIIHMQCGPVRFKVTGKEVSSQELPKQRLIVRETEFTLAPSMGDAGIQEIYAALSKDDLRNQLIFDDVMMALEEGRSPIVLTERKDHLDLLSERMRNFTRHLIVLKGGLGSRQMKTIRKQLLEIPDDEERLILATGRFVGEGFDDSRLDTLFLALPVSWKGTLVQYAGRLSRQHPGKREVRIYDYVDAKVPMLARMFDKRRRGYKTMGYGLDG